MLFYLYHIAHANANLGPETKLEILVCVIKFHQTQTLGVFSTIETNDTHWIRKRKR